MDMKHTLRMVTVACSFVAATAAAQGQAWPTQPIKVVVLQPAGGGSDVIARLVSDKIAASLKQPIVIDNKPGASGAIAADLVAKSLPDGYTFLACTSSSQVMLPLMGNKLSYDPVRDLAPVGIVSRADYTLVVPASSPFKTMRDLIDYGKANPGKLSYGTIGIGTTAHLAAELLQMQGGFQATAVPYKGTPAAEPDLASGRLDFFLDSTAAILPSVRAGRSRALLVTGAVRSPALPDTPTSREAGLPDYEVYGYMGFCAPAGTPAGVIDRFYSEAAKAVDVPEVKQRLLALGFDGRPLPPAEMNRYNTNEIQRWRHVITTKNIRLQ